MSCTINEIRLSFDKNSKVKNAINRVAGTNSAKATILAAWASSKDFLKFVGNNLSESDVLKGQKVDFENVSVNDLTKINSNKLFSVFNNYYRANYRAVENQRTKVGDKQLNGFTSIAAKRAARSYTAYVIKDIYQEEILKPADKRKTPQEIIAEVNRVLLLGNSTTAGFYDRVNNLAEKIINNPNSSKESIEAANKFLEAVDAVKNYKDNVSEHIAEKRANNAEIEANNAKALETSDKKILKQLKEKNDSLKNRNNQLDQIIKNKKEESDNVQINKLIAAQDLAFDHIPKEEYSEKEVLNNYANLVIQARANANEWFFQVFNTKDMTSISKDFSKLGNIQEFLEEMEEDGDIEVSYNDSTVDETTKSWEDSMYKNVTSSVSSRIRLVLSTVPKLRQPYIDNGDTSTPQDIFNDNPLKVAEYMNAQYAISQIFSVTNHAMSSRNNFVNALDKATKTVPELYGLGAVVAQMKRNPVFLNEMFASFAKPIIKKSILEVTELTAENGFKFDISNPNANKVSGLYYKMSTKIKGNYYGAYDVADTQTLNTINELSVEDASKTLTNIFIKYFPKVDNNIINNYISNAAEKTEAIKKISSELSNLVNGVRGLKEDIKNQELKNNQEYKAAYEAWKADKSIDKGDRPSLKYVNISDFSITPTINKAMLNLTKTLVDYTDSKVRLTSANAEGNNSSDVAKNCYATRLIEQLNAESEQDKNDGAKHLLSYYTQGMENGGKNQYFHNPLLFGLRDENGIELQGELAAQGLFRKDSNGFFVNDNAKQLLDISLFNGSKNNQTTDGASYAKMTKLDFFISQYFAYKQSLPEATDDGFVTDVNGLPTGVYPMRIGSDAPKIYMIKSHKYNKTQLQYAFYNHLMNEVQIMVNGLNTLFTQEHNGRMYVNKNTHNLIDRVLYNGSVVKDGKLTGNAFKFQRLFDINGVEKNEQAAEKLNQIFSLYGEFGTVKTDESGELYIDKSATDTIIKFDEHSNKFEFLPEPEQKRAILQVVDTWMNNFRKDVITRIQPFVDTMNKTGIENNTEDIMLYLYNTTQMNMAYDDLFEGDYKLYKNARDFLKRTKETQAGGDAYSAYDMTEEYSTVLKELNTYDGNPEVIYNKYEYADKPMIARNGFRAITIRGTQNKVDGVAELKENLRQGYIRDGYSEEYAYNQSVAVAEGWVGTAERGKTTKINDAQSYITFEEFVRRVHADGTYYQYAALIDKIMDSNVKAEDISIADVNSQIQVRKNFYYDKIYDEHSGLYYSRQVKNAEFVIIPKLLPSDSHLTQIYDWMKKNDIGQINTEETSKAGNKNLYTIWDNDGNLTDSFIKDVNEENNVEDFVNTYQYKYLYKQQEVPHHIGDTKNKAAVQIMKKIVDNIYHDIEEEELNNGVNNERTVERAKLKKYAEDFQNAFSENIKEDFYNFLDMVGWKYDDVTNKIVNKEPEIYGEQLNFDEFYSRAREEAARLGMDSNFMEFIIPDPLTGKPNMPTWMSTVSTKLESIAQSLFNKNITRQTLPGWHAAQITHVGYSKKLKFDGNTGVMEVYLPRWSNLIPKNYPIELLEKEGLDIHIGYRIPTEGKQSISVLKVVGFVDEALGSTIVVPDAWVEQTGSDFDVDSVYGINWEMYTTRENGKTVVKKVPYTEDTVDNEKLYIDYIKQHINTKLERRNLNEEIKEKTQHLKDRLEDYKNNSEEVASKLNELNQIRKEYDKQMPKDIRGLVRSLQQAENAPRHKDGKYNQRDGYPQIIDALNNKLSQPNEYTEEQITAIKGFTECLETIVEQLHIKDGLSYYSENKLKQDTNTITKEIIEAEKRDTLKRYENAAAESGLESFEEFIKKPFLERLNRKGRNNVILANMINIMNSYKSKEEQWGKSTFDDVIVANKKVDKIIAKASNKVSQSPYNPLDQLDYFEDVMGGARLKALSVNWDTFVSKINRLRMYLSEKDVIQVIIDTTETDTNTGRLIYNEAMIRESYAEDIVDNTKFPVEGEVDTKTPNSSNTITLNARRLGWSRNNHNIVGKLCTTYTAQTTAHHLDAVKEGSIQNVNEYTFNVYKLLSSLGIDFETTISFIRQPIITNIVNNNNIVNSIFFKSVENPIDMTIKDIANRYGLKTKFGVDNTSTYKLIEGLSVDNAVAESFKNIFGIDIKSMSSAQILNIKVPLNKKQLFDRLASESSKKVNLAGRTAFDLGILLTFRNLRKTSNVISDYITSSSADKVGADASLRKVNQFVDKIEELRKDRTLYKDDKGVIDLIYPAIDGVSPREMINERDSEFRSLGAMLNYSTLPSRTVNSQLFITGNENFLTLESNLKKFIGRNLNDKEYKEFTKYIVANYYMQNAKLFSKVSLNERGNVIYEQSASAEDASIEYARIFGYGIDSKSTFKIDNKYELINPTVEQIEEFKTLTPGQKVEFIQSHFENGDNIFNHLTVNFWNSSDVRSKKLNRQYISYDDQVDVSEDLVHLFHEAFFSHNPLIKLAAIDLVKYSFIAEGYDYKTNYISKIVPNSVLYTDSNNGGMDIINDLNRDIYDYIKENANSYTESTTADLIHKYIRSHTGILKTNTELMNYNDNYTQYFISRRRKSNLIHIDNTSDNKGVKILINKLKLKDNEGKFIKVQLGIAENKSAVVVYKVKGENATTVKDENGDTVYSYADYYLIPINPLDSNEKSDMSFNEANNRFNLYEEYISEIEEINRELKRDNSINVNETIHLTDYADDSKNDVIARKNKEMKIRPYNTQTSSYNAKDPYALINAAEQANDVLKGGVNKLINDIQKEFNESGNKTTAVSYNNNIELKKIFINETQAVEQTIPTNDGNKTFKIRLATKEERNRWTSPNARLGTNKSLKQAIQSFKDSQQLVTKSTFYVATIVQDSNEDNQAKIYNAHSELITAADEEVKQNEPTFTVKDPIDIVSKKVIEQINYDALKNRNKKAIEFNRTLNKNRVASTNLASRKENKNVIYSAAAKYYRSQANGILNRANEFTIGTETYRLDDPILYEALKEHDEMYKDVACLIMDGLTFGTRIDDIMSLDIAAEDIETKNAIESIVNTIGEVRQNNIFKKALDNIFNIYFKKYATNPDVVNDIIKLRETFGDMDTIDSWILDPAEIKSPEVQVVLKKVWTVLNKAEMYESVENEKEFRNRLAEINAMSGELNRNKVIDSKKGKVIQDFTDDFITERNNIFDAYNEASLTKHRSFEHYKKYIDTKLAKDEFMFKHTVQPLVDDYYKRDIDMRKKVIELAGDFYYEYQQLSSQFYAKKDLSSLTKDEIDERNRIKARMDDLRSTTYENGELKPYAEERAAIFINKYLKERQALNKQYFTYQEYEGFTDDYIKNSKFIKEFDNNNPQMTLEQKLGNKQYKDAYDWLANNGKVDYTDEVKEEINKAFKALTGHTGAINKTTLKALRNNPDLKDEYGRFDPTKLNEEQIKLLKQQEMGDLARNYDNGYGEAVLIKSIPNDIPILEAPSTLTEEEKELFSSIKYGNNREKYRIIGEINEILTKVIDTSTGSLNMSMLFNDNIVSNEEREHLGNLYAELRALRGSKYDWTKREDNEVYSDEINMNAYTEHRVFYEQFITDPAKQLQFYNIFTIEDTTGRSIPNPLIYGYKMPKDKYTNKEKTNARKFLKENIRFVVTDKYIQKRAEIEAQGRDIYEQWYKDNHIFNPYSHKYEPLKVWTKQEAIPGSKAAKSISYHPSFNNQERSAKKESYRNNSNIKQKYVEGQNNYRMEAATYIDSETGATKTLSRDSKYDNNIVLNEKERAYKDLIVETLNKYATTYKGRRFINQGYMPRDRKPEIDWKYGVQQGMAMVGLSWQSGAHSDNFSEQRDYAHDKEVEMKMLALIKGKGSKKLINLPSRNEFATEEEYIAEVRRVKEENKAIIAQNEQIDNANINTNWDEVIAQFVHNATIFNSKENIKPYLYLLLEELKQNKAYKLGGYWNRHVVKDSNEDGDSSDAKYEDQTNTYDMIHNYGRRIIFSEYHKNSFPRTVANFLQNTASAKFMITNLYGGIANITTGEVQIGMEFLANEYFEKGDFSKANAEYLKSVPAIFASMYSDKSSTQTVAFMKEFNVVDFDQVLQFGAGSEGLDENLRRMRSWLYGFQSGGEHLMQNSVLLAMLDSHRLYTDKAGVMRIGSYNDYVADLEDTAMLSVIGGNKDLKRAYNRFKTKLQNDTNAKYNIVSGRKNINRAFLQFIKMGEGNAKYKEIAKAYHTKRDELLKNAKEEFNNENNITVRNLHDFVDGKLKLKEEYASRFYKDGKMINSIGNLEDLISDFKQKVIQTNKKIHGVYDKNGAAKIEKEWYGSLIMQYHKHLYPGIMKRWRRRGFYSEFRGTRERGSYQTLLDFVGTEFDNFKERMDNKDTNVVLASIQVAMESVLSTLNPENIKMNWNNLSKWEQNNIKRNLADVAGVLAACLVVAALYGLWDDDDIKEDGFKSSALYLADRLYADSMMYSPFGLDSEYRTLWSSPIAGATGPNNYLKGVHLLTQWMFDPDFNMEYDRGLYKGRNKFGVLITKEVPGVRPYYRIKEITKNNKYYKIGNDRLGIKATKNFMESL